MRGSRSTPMIARWRGISSTASSRISLKLALVRSARSLTPSHHSRRAAASPRPGASRRCCAVWKKLPSWREGNATALPFQNASFDIVCCSQGLQFFPDRVAALGEMFRVVGPVGRLALAVWRGIEHQPFYSALADALERYVSPEAAASLRAAFTLTHADELRALIAGAGFRDIRITIRSRLTR